MIETAYGQDGPEIVPGVVYVTKLNQVRQYGLRTQPPCPEAFPLAVAPIPEFLLPQARRGGHTFRDSGTC